MIKLLLSGLMLLPAHQFKPIPIPPPKPKKVTFQVGMSEYEQSWQSGILTAYYNGKDRMNGELGITASGYNLDNGIYYQGYRILAADRSIPLGTLIDIKIGDEVINCVVLDRGGRIHGRHFDLVVSDLDTALGFGVEQMEWQIVGNINI